MLDCVDSKPIVHIDIIIMALKLRHLPDYCDLFKEFLVEELVFFESPYDFHYGKCSVIGKLSIRDGFHYLQNISLSGLDSEYRLKTGTVEILLLPTSYRSDPSNLSSFEYLVNGAFYEVHGEAAYTPKDKEVDLNSVTVTTFELIVNLRLNHLMFTDTGFANYDAQDVSLETLQQINVANLERELKEFETAHVPAIQVHTMNEIDEAEELIQTNLQLRRLRTKRRQENN